QKYGTFGYRLINLDAGAAVSQLHVVATSLGVGAWTADRWAGDLIEQQLHLESPGEQVTAVVALFRGNTCVERESGPRVSDPEPASRFPGALKPAREFSGFSLSETLDMLVCESRTTEQDLRRRTFS